MNSLLNATQDRRVFLRTVAAGVLTSMFANRPAWAQSGEAITLEGWVRTEVYWNDLAQMFQDEFPNVTCNFGPAAGNNGELLLKLRNALRAGVGIPNVVEMQVRDIASFSFINELADQAQFGANEHESKFPAWLWNQMKAGENAIVGLPTDLGPMAMVYRQDVFDEFGLEVPTTWEEMREQGRKLKEQTSDHIMMALNLTEAGAWAVGMFWGNGSVPFKINGTNVYIDINNEASRRVCAYWDEMIGEGLADTTPAYTPDWWALMDQGRFASYPVAAWMNSFNRNARDGMGKYRVARMPQWDPATPKTGAWGGSAMTVMERSANKEAAADYVRFATTVAEHAELQFTKYSMMPSLNEVRNDPRYANQEIPLLGGQQGNRVFLEAAEMVDTSFQWSPFNDFVEGVMNDEFGKASGGAQTCIQALERSHELIVDYATDQGFSVTTP